MLTRMSVSSDDCLFHQIATNHGRGLGSLSHIQLWWTNLDFYDKTTNSGYMVVNKIGFGDGK